MLEINQNTIMLETDAVTYCHFGSDQANVNFPVRFPTVTLGLESTIALDRIVDAMRVEAGHKPMFPDNWEELDTEDWDDNGWYNFWVGLNGFTDTMVDTCIEAVVQSEWADDNEQSYYIPLSEAEQIAIYNELNRQLRERFGTSCDELLEEARQEMIELEEYKVKHKEVF